MPMAAGASWPVGPGGGVGGSISSSGVQTASAGWADAGGGTGVGESSSPGWLVWFSGTSLSGWSVGLQMAPAGCTGAGADCSLPSLGLLVRLWFTAGGGRAVASAGWYRGSWPMGPG